MLAFGVLFAFALRELFIWLRAVIARRGAARRPNGSSRIVPIAVVGGHAAGHARAVRGPHGRRKGIPARDAALLSGCAREGPGAVRDPRTAALLAGTRRRTGPPIRSSTASRSSMAASRAITNWKARTSSSRTRPSIATSSGRARPTDRSSTARRRRRTSSRRPITRLSARRC